MRVAGRQLAGRGPKPLIARPTKAVPTPVSIYRDIGVGIELGGIVLPNPAILSPALIDATLFQDDQTINSISSADMQQFVWSVGAGLFATIQTGSWTAALADRGTLVEMNVSSGSANFIVPTNASVPFDVGVLLYVSWLGTIQPTLVPADGTVTLRTPSSLTPRAQYCGLRLRQRAVNDWVVSGDMT